MPIRVLSPLVLIDPVELAELRARVAALDAVSATLAGYLARKGAITRAEVGAALALNAPKGTRR